MKEADCVALLRWALPQRRLRWAGYLNVRGQVCKRIRRRMSELGLPDVAAYRARLASDDSEWPIFERMAVVTISRFYRDPPVWNALRAEVLPVLARAALAAGDRALACFSMGCASGEEPYTLSVLWSSAFADLYPALGLRVLAADIDARVLARAARARYSAATLRDLPEPWRLAAFERDGERFVLREPFRAAVELEQRDVHGPLPAETFRLVLCRNSVFTYFDEELQRDTLRRVVDRMADGAALVVGRHEHVPEGAPLAPWQPELGIYRVARAH